MIELLPHNQEHCTGRWVQQWNTPRPHWRCDSCSAVAYQCPDTDRAALYEYMLGLRMIQMARDGARQLRDENEPPEWLQDLDELPPLWW